MNKRLGTSEARIDDSLDAMLAMVRQKEEQAKKLELLRQQKEAEQKKREEKIAWLQKERGKKIIASLEAEIVKYREIVASKYGKSLKSSAWQALIAKCPSGWADGVDEGDVETILFSPAQRKEREKEEKKRFEETMGMKFVYVPKGCFMMGSNSGNSNEKPIHEVCLEGFWMGKYEVTQGQWNKIMGTNPSKFNSRDDFPVDNVSWNDAQNFILKLNQQFGNRFRLPTEAQWEYAAKSGGKKQKYAGGNDVGNLAWYDSNGYYKTRRVGTKAANGLGIYDMSGNVWEWCEDEFESNAYSKHDHYNPVVKSSSLFKVMRGGSWGSDATGVRVSNRSKRSCDVRGSANGFRLCIVKGWQ